MENTKEFTVEDFDAAMERGDWPLVYRICRDVDFYGWRPDGTVNLTFSISTMQDGEYEPACSDDFDRIRQRIKNLFGGKVKVDLGPWRWLPAYEG